MKSEVDMRARGHLVSIIGHSAAGMNYEMRDVLNVLGPIARSDDSELRRRGMLALAKAISEVQVDVSPYIDEVLQIAFSPPPTAERLSALRPLIERLARSDVKLAASVLGKLIQGAMEIGIGTSGSQKLFGRLKPTARMVVRLTTPGARKELLELVPKLDRILGSLVLDAICHEALTEFPDELDELLKSNVPGELKEIILNYRYTQERALLAVRSGLSFTSYCPHKGTSLRPCDSIHAVMPLSCSASQRLLSYAVCRLSIIYHGRA